MSAKEFRKTVSNIIALLSRLYDLYGLAALAYNSKIGWFSNSDSSSFDASTLVNGEAFYESYAFFFYLSLSVSVIYYFVGRIAVYHVD